MIPDKKPYDTAFTLPSDTLLGKPQPGVGIQLRPHDLRLVRESDAQSERVDWSDVVVWGLAVVTLINFILLVWHVHREWQTSLASFAKTVGGQ